MPATSDAAASASRPDGSSRPPEPAILYENHDWDVLEAQVPILWGQLNDHMASR